MVMKSDDIVNALGKLEMRGGMHCISEELRAAIIAALSAPVAAAVEKPKRGRPPLNKGTAPE
jgi:hypothetical protein